MPYRRSVPLGAVALAAFLSIAAGAPPEAPPESAQSAWGVWTPKELRFVYMGFTSHYSCDGLRDKMRSILLQLGARPDLSVREVPCSGGAGRPTEFPGVTVKMNVLAPWDAQTSSPTATPVPAHWKPVEINTDRDPLREAGDCELVEQVKSRVMPLLYARNVDYHSNCVPNQLQIGGTQLKGEVLIADDQSSPGPGAQAPTSPAAPPSAGSTPQR